MRQPDQIGMLFASQTSICGITKFNPITTALRQFACYSKLCQITATKRAPRAAPT